MWSLKYAQATLIAGGFAQVYGRDDAKTIVVSDKYHLTEGQRKALQQEIYDSLTGGYDVTIQTLSGKSTTLVEENSYNIAQIHGHLIRHGDFSHGEAERKSEIERNLHAVSHEGQNARASGKEYAL